MTYARGKQNSSINPSLKAISIYIAAKISNKVWWFTGGSIVYHVSVGIIFFGTGKKDLALYLYMMANL